MASLRQTAESPSRRQRELLTPVQYLKGVGPDRAERLAKMGIRTAADLLFLIPHRYEDFTSLATPDNLPSNEDVSLLVEVTDFEGESTRSGKYIVKVQAQIMDPQHSPPRRELYVTVTWFNQFYLMRKLREGQLLLLQGKLKRDEDAYLMNHPRLTWLDSDVMPREQGELIPVYPLTGGINQYRMRKMVAGAVERYANLLDDVFPEEFRREKSLIDIQSAVNQIHAPLDSSQVDQARYRLIYQELFVQQAALALRRKKLDSRQSAPPLPVNPVMRSRILNRLPFQLTESQRRAVDELVADMARTTPMNRLIHGEVGSGKTVVATFAILLAVAHGCQAVLMAPTEILVEQHTQNLRRWLEGSRVEVETWTGSMTDRQRLVAANNIREGKSSIVIGTHALITADLQFKHLGLVVVDEQHKFGVKQRARVRAVGGGDPHYLVMTATPIPRTISLTAYGDLDVTTLRTGPELKTEVHTYLGTEDRREQWWEFFRKKLREGRQGYVIAPLVDSTDDATASAEQLFESLTNGPLEAFRVDLLHGGQKTEEKLQIMHAFDRGHTQVLVATSVVEVGIDVPNATVATIESAERFGLSQLHQLRGRVSRGAHPGFVCVFPSPHVDLEDPSSGTKRRLTALTESSDGFELAEIDLAIRGPGDFFSARQHGFPPLRIADLTRDADLLTQVRQDARELIDRDPELEAPDFARLRSMILSRYGASLELSDVG